MSKTNTNPPKLATRNGGVLKIPASATQPRPVMASAAGVPSAPRLKILIRRLPPGLTEEEFQTALGDEWKVGSGRVDWASYKPGKVSKDPNKPSKPSRGYLNLTKQEYINVLSDTVRNAKFNDSKNSAKDPVLRGPPSVEFAPYGKVPRARVRKDARQGTIDQDPEFIEFLESLTNPVPKPASVDQPTAAGKSKEKVTTTPLIQFLKEKKANKGKEGPAAAAKGAKHTRQTSKDAVSGSNSGSDKTSPAKAVATTTQTADKRSAQAIMVEKAARDATRVVNKQALASSKSQSPSPAAVAPADTPVPAVSSPLAEKKRERGSASAAASILRRDLGIGAGPGARGGRRGGPVGQNRTTPTSSPKVTPATLAQGESAKAADNSTTKSSGTTPSTSNASTTPATTSTPTQPVKPPTGPAVSRVPPKTPASSMASASNTTSTPKPTATTSTATQAFLKHANPSQGITEPLLEEAFSTYGPVKRVEIDRKKGSAYVDFEAPEGLQKAIQASPVKVAQGQVVVLERRMGPNPPARNTTRGGGGGVMGSNNRGGVDVRGGVMAQRGGMMGQRGGGVPVGPMAGRGGSVRGRGGLGRGRGNVSGAVNARAAATTGPVQESKVAIAAATTSKDEASNTSIPAVSTEAAKSSTEAPAAAGEQK
ncbi:MAG: hypothetical protein Q9216_005018 [Gyalolechia sp. 2 TL-2023]